MPEERKKNIELIKNIDYDIQRTEESLRQVNSRLLTTTHVSKQSHEGRNKKLDRSADMGGVPIFQTNLFKSQEGAPSRLKTPVR